jgi:hypothetical protein
MYAAETAARGASTVGTQFFVQQMAFAIVGIVVIILYAVTDIDIGRGSNAHAVVLSGSVWSICWTILSGNLFARHQKYWQ